MSVCIVPTGTANLASVIGALARTAGRPTLAICLGLQLLAVRSEEAPGTTGLGVLATAVTRLPDSVSVPQLGWNLVRGGELVRDGHAYFANSYRLTQAPEGWRGVWADHGGPLVAALERGPQLLCQFHPELSGGWGHELLGRWLALAGVGTGAADTCGAAGPADTVGGAGEAAAC